MAISRDHTVHISRSGLVTIAGGKWTTYRKMAEDTIDQAATVAQLDERPSVTRELRIHGYHPEPERFGSLGPYGSEAPAVEDLLREQPRYRETLHPRLDVRAGEVVWAVRREMARTVEDFLSRAYPLFAARRQGQYRGGAPGRLPLLSPTRLTLTVNRR